MEILALLNPHSKDLRMLPPGFQHLTSQDISHALSYIKTKGPRLVGRYKHAEQLVYKKSLNDELFKAMQKTAKLNKWKNTQSLHKLTEIAVDVYCHQPRCKTCKGIGERMWGARKIVCPTCNGSTWLQISDAEISRTIGVDPSNYHRVHKDRMTIAMRILADWDRICCGVIAKSIR